MSAVGGAQSEPPRRPPSTRLSLTNRLLLAASLVLVVGLGVTGVILDAAYQASARAAVQDRLQGHIYTLLAAAELGADGKLFVPDSIPEARFSRPGSGLYAHIDGQDFEWSSTSATGESLIWPETPLAPAILEFSGPLALNGDEAFVMQMGIAWELEDGERRFTISAAETTASYLGQVAAFRRTLWLWLSAVVIVLLALQGVILRWGLRPLRTVSSALREVERGDSETLGGRYPAELRGLTDHLNRFIGHERRTLERYRNSLSDLAHSLKTPLAVLRSAAETGDAKPAEVIDQVQRMDDIVAYQLQKASTSGHLTFSRPIAIAEPAEQIVASLEKVFATKGVVCEFLIDQDAQFFGERGDLMEMLGNLIDNAFKWCTQQVIVGAQPVLTAGRPGCNIWVEDDGSGIDPELTEQLFRRGVRGDEKVHGHGIGLAMVFDIVSAYDGEIQVSRGKLGGARIVLEFPGDSGENND